MPLPEGKFDLAYNVRTSTYRGQPDIQVEWMDARLCTEGEIDVNARKRAIQVVDYRQEANPHARLQQLRHHELIQVWCESVNCESVEGVSRTGLIPGMVLAIWTAPPGRGVLLQALEAASPEKVYLFGIDPKMDHPDAFMKRLAGLVKHVLNTRSGIADLIELSAACAQRIEAVMAGINLLHANGFIKVLKQEEETLNLEQGDGMRTGDLLPAGEALKLVLQESAAYRAYFTRADAVGLIERAEEDDP